MIEQKKLEAPYFIPYYLLVFLAIVLLTIRIPATLDEGKPHPSTLEKKHEQIDPTAVKPHEGYLAPDFTLKDEQGNDVSLSQYKGKKVVFLNFWATWCKPCREEAPSMETVWQKFKDTDFIMLAVSIDKNGNEAVAPFKKDLGLTFPVLFDQDSKIANLYETTGVPETFIISKSGRIMYKGVGAQNWAEPDALEAFDSIIKGKMPGPVDPEVKAKVDAANAEKEKAASEPAK